MTVVTVSRQLGSRGEEVAVGVAQSLGLRLIDAETINQAAQSAGVPKVALAEWGHEGGRGLANRVLNALRAMPSTYSGSMAPIGEAGVSQSDQSSRPMPFGGLFSPLIPPISASFESYVHIVGMVIRGLAHEGNVLVVGRGGQMLLKNHPQALHVQIVAPLAFRTAVIMDRLGLEKRAAQSRVRASDRARFDYVRRYHDADWLDPTLYHLVVNTARMPVDRAIDLIVTAQGAMDPRQDDDSPQKQTDETN